MTINHEDLIAEAERFVRETSDEFYENHLVRALTTRLRESEKQRDEARWAAGIVGDVARESSGGWQDASAELHATQNRLREAEAVIEQARAKLPGPRTFAESMSRDFAGNLWPRNVDADEIAAILATYKPTNQEEP